MAAQRRNIGILAHVDAGKTTLTERIPYLCGGIQSQGSVDAGTAHTDTLSVERTRGISVKAASACCAWKGVEIALVDTPGHADFSSEVERSLWALDGAVLVLSAVEGVQAQTELLYAALRQAHIPVVFFLNKVDRVGADRDRVLREIREVLSAPAAALWEEEALLDAVCETDDDLLARYLEGEPPAGAEVRGALARACRAGTLCPVLSGAALRGQGVEALLDAVVDFLPPPAGDAAGALCGVVFAVTMDKTMGRGAQVRLYSGALQNRQAVGESKVTQIRTLRGTRWEDRGALSAGEIGMVYGLGDVRPGDVLGDASLVPEGRLRAALAEPLLSSRVEPEDEKDLRALREALEELSIEDPHLDAQWSSFTHELYVRLTGAIQVEVLQALLEERFGLRCRFAPPTVIYKETIAHEAEGFVAYTMPKPCWAVVRLLVEPLPRGSGIQFESIIKEKELPYRYQNHVRQSLPEALRQGRKGWEVTDAKFTLIGGQHHHVHTHPLDFFVATPVAVQRALVNSGTLLLEPMVRVTLSAQEELLGKVIRDMVAMRGAFDTPILHQGTFTLEADLPVATSLDYPTAFRSMTSGKGVYASAFLGYQECPPGEGKEAPRRGVDPLDHAKWILTARSAMQ